MSQWFTRLFRRTPQRPFSKSAARRHGFRPRLEALEDRLVPSTFTVTNTNDSGAGSLRAEVALAQNGDTVNFDSSLAGQTINLTSGQIQVANGVAIDNETGSAITIDGTNNSSRIFEILGGTSGVGAVINNLALNNSTI